MSQRDLVAELLTAIDIVTESHMKNLQYDITKTCTVYDDSDSQNGHYIVTDGSIRFSAYSESESYKNDDSVRVLIPSGDFTQKKYITGKAVSDNDTTPITYVSPLETTLNVSGNLMGSYDGPWGLQANGDIESITIWQMNMNDSRYKDLQNNGIYDTITLRADFKSLLSNYKMYGGNYGLRLTAYLAPLGSRDATSTLVSYLDSSKMYGNPYSFSVYSTQELKIDIGQLGNIRRLVLDFYQEKNFTYYTSSNRDVVPVKNDYQGNPINNLFVKDISIGFGSDLTKITSHTLKIFTDGIGEYNEDTNIIDERNISLLWYNMDEEGRYIGFSDGIYDPTYDERDYLELARVNARLAEQEGKKIPLDERGMELSADAEDVSATVDYIETAITKDLKAQLQAFWRKISDIADTEGDGLYDLFSQLCDGEEGCLIYEVAENMLDTKLILMNYWKDALESAYSRWVIKEYDNKVLLPSEARTAEAQIRKLITDVTDAVAVLLTTAKEKIQKSHGGFMSIYDAYEIRINKVIADIEEQLDLYKGLVVLEDDNAKAIDDLQAYFDADFNYKPHTLTDLSAYDNRYCIYWYKYAPEEATEETNFMSYGWVEITNSKNICLPGESSDTPGYYMPKAENENVLHYELSKQKNNEKIAVVLFYNHTQYNSEQLEFTNVNPPIDPNIQALVGSAFIEHSKDSHASYQLYDINNSLVNMSERARSRSLRARFIDPGQESIDDLTDASLADTQIFWYIPTAATMLDYNLKDLPDFYNDLEGTKSSDSREGYACFYRKIRANTNPAEGAESDKILSEDRYFTYRIKDYYLPTSTNNIISCVIRKGEVDYEAEIDFNFSSYGTSGTDYTLTVQPSGLNVTACPRAEDDKTDDDLKLMISLFDYNNSIVPIKEEANYSYDEATIESIGWYGASRDTVLSKNSVAPVYQEDGKVEITILNETFNPDMYNVLEVAVRLSPDEKGLRKNDTVLSVLYAIPFTNGNPDQYVIDGTSHIIYDSSGSSPSYYKDPYVLYERVDKELIPIEANWRIEPAYYDDGGNLLQDTEGNRMVPDILKAFVPALNNKNQIVPANLYVDGTQENIHCVVIASKGTDEVWYQPIIITQNRYPSTMLNSWDGSLQINEEDGTILSTMVGAGRKNANNRFEGVLMGDVASTAEDDSTGTGIFGYHDGAQSFAFNINGTASIGKSGRGRIHFDGNSGTISSASWEQTKRDEKDGVIQSAGMMIDLDDGRIELRGASYNNESEKYEKATNSLLRLDVMAPYATIDSQAGNHLLFIGDATPRIKGPDGLPTKNEYTGRLNVGEGYNSAVHGFYLQSDNYDPDSDGMRIDLEEGYIDAFNFSLNSEHFKINSMGNFYYPYMWVGDAENNDLINISEEGFLIQSADEMIVLSSGGELADYYLKIGKGTAPLLEVSDYSFALRTSDYSSTQGMEIDLYHGTLNAHDGFYLEASGTGGFIKINAEAGSYPLEIGSRFQVKWDGSLIANYGTFTNIDITSGTISIGGGNFVVGNDGSVSMKGGLTVSNSATITGTVNIGGNVTIAGENVDITGKITASSGKIGGWTINANDITNGSISLDALNSKITAGGSGTSGTSFSFGGNGQVLASNAKMNDLLVTNSLTVGTNKVFYCDASGNLTIKGALTIKGNIDMGGYGYTIGSGSTYAGYYSNGIFNYGNLFSINTTSFQVTDGVTATFKGTVYIDGVDTYFTGGNAYFNADTNIYIGGINLKTYIKQNGSSLISFGNSSLSSKIEDLEDRISKLENKTVSVSWSNITGKPSKFPAESHDHSGTGHSHTISSGATSTGTTYLYLSGP